jgi:hypothetical protein
LVKKHSPWVSRGFGYTACALLVLLSTDATSDVSPELRDQRRTLASNTTIFDYYLLLGDKADHATG